MNETTTSVIVEPNSALAVALIGVIVGSSLAYLVYYTLYTVYTLNSNS